MFLLHKHTCVCTHVNMEMHRSKHEVDIDTRRHTQICKYTHTQVWVHLYKTLPGSHGAQVAPRSWFLSTILQSKEPEVRGGGECLESRFGGEKARAKPAISCIRK